MACRRRPRVARHRPAAADGQMDEVDGDCRLTTRVQVCRIVLGRGGPVGRRRLGPAFVLFITEPGRLAGGLTGIAGVAVRVTGAGCWLAWLRRSLEPGVGVDAGPNQRQDASPGCFSQGRPPGSHFGKLAVHRGARWRGDSRVNCAGFCAARGIAVDGSPCRIRLCGIRVESCRPDIAEPDVATSCVGLFCWPTRGTTLAG